jgi:mono/diheme cytochrome c family protein
VDSGQWIVGRYLPVARMMREKLSRFIAVFASALLVAPTIVLGADERAALEVFERDVRPVLVESCQKCHGPEKQESDLRVDSRAALLKGGASGAAIVPGKPTESLLVEAIHQTGDYKMPPKAKLSADKIAAIERWIELGAPWPDSLPANDPKRDAAKSHWAFQPVTDPGVPTNAGVERQPENPVDAFVQAKLLAAELSSSPRAGRRELIRRATFDLTGLPPTPEDVAAFEQNDDPRAFEQLVDRLLASPHYGERWGRHWLDVARYADTKGYVYAREQRFWVHAWVYRDWVVKALNDDMPYDRFLLMQIAADQAEGATQADLAAMGYLTLGRRFIGVTHDIIDDRIDVVTRGTMGLTVACARCHDHKYDPIPTRDYYSLYGVFQNCIETLTPIAEAATRDEAHEKEAYAKFEQELAKRQKKYDDTFRERREEANGRLRRRVADYLIAQTQMEKYPDEGFDQVLEKDDVIPASVRRWQAYLAQAANRGDRVFEAWRMFALLDDKDAADAAEVFNLEVQPNSNARVTKAFDPPPKSLAEVAQRYGELFIKVDEEWQTALKQAKEKNQPPPTALANADAEELRAVLYGPDAPATIPDEPILHTETYFDLGSCDLLWKLQGEIDSLLIQSPAAPPHADILRDRANPLPAYVFKRGRPATKGDEAPRQFLELLSGSDRRPFAHGSGRLELAKAIVDPKNPLTARVIVNRVWMHHFGDGLVLTPSDFGTRAETPSHPELLDWLTSRFIADGWSLKKLHRRIMLSDVYCQSSAGPDDAAARANANERDPANRLLWRMIERRLSFEEMRDALFAATGELDLAIGGKPAEIFTGEFKRRTLYGLVDRQFLPSALRVFDFANPDLHIPERSDTTVPQQALFFLNNAMPLDRAKALAARTASSATRGERVQAMYRLLYQRAASERQVAAALALVEAASNQREAEIPPTTRDWQYGIAAFDEKSRAIKNFSPLPHFAGEAWQGGDNWPDKKFGWAQLTATGGHPGNTLEHAVVRRWTAPRDMTVAIDSSLSHDKQEGDGVRATIVSSTGSVLASATVHKSHTAIKQAPVHMKAGETLDFVVDIGGTLSHDEFAWEITIASHGEANGGPSWNSARDFLGPTSVQLDPWAQLAQVLFSANEFVFVD